MNRGHDGFSLLELMLAMTITLGIGLITFQLFQQNERIFRDQNFIIEMQQSARAVASQIADELRMAGQGVPVYASKFDGSPQEAAQWLLDGSDNGTIRFRAAIRNVYSTVSGASVTYAVGSSTGITVADAQPFSDAVQSSTNYCAYIWGPTATSWGWLRCQITSINTPSNTITLTPVQNGSTVSASAATFAATPTISLEERISYSLSGTSIFRGLSTNVSSLTSTTFDNQEIGRNFSSLSFTYYDAAGNAVTPGTLANRTAVRRVDIRVVAQTSQNISNGTRPTYAVSLRIYPRNVGIL